MKRASDIVLTPPECLVRIVGGYFEFLQDGDMVYDFAASDPGEALRWVEHIAQKTWVTKKHLEQFARLAADKFGVRYR